MYRPFTKHILYYDKGLIERPGAWSQIFPTNEHKNIVIIITGIGAGKPFSSLITNSVPSNHTLDTNQSFPLNYYEERRYVPQKMFGQGEGEGYVRRDVISDFIIGRARAQYGKEVSKEDIFYYVYGFLHSQEYRKAFANDLKKSLPRLPLVERVQDFWAFSKAGRQLADTSTLRAGAAASRSSGFR